MWRRRQHSSKRQVLSCLPWACASPGMFDGWKIIIIARDSTLLKSLHSFCSVHRKGRDRTDKKKTNLFNSLITVVSRWEELHVLASEPMESHVFFAEHFYDAVNGLYTTLSTFSVCSATPAGRIAITLLFFPL